MMDSHLERLSCRSVSAKSVSFRATDYGGHGRRFDCSLRADCFSEHSENSVDATRRRKEKGSES